MIEKTKIDLIHNNHHRKEARISATFPCKESRACIRILLNVTISISTGLSSTSLEMSLEGINIKNYDCLGEHPKYYMLYNKCGNSD